MGKAQQEVREGWLANFLRTGRVTSDDAWRIYSNTARTLMSERMHYAWHTNRIAVGAFVVCGTMVGALLGLPAAMWMTERNPPIQVLDSHFVNPVIEEGQLIDLYVHVTSTTNRTCPGDITREYITEYTFSNGAKLLTVDGKPMPRIIRDDGQTPIPNANQKEYVVSFSSVVKSIPIPPGKWKFRGQTSYYCGWFAKTSYIAEIEYLTIVPKGTLTKDH